MRDWTIRQAGGPEALKAAVAAIYFNDSSDYESALWTVVRELCPEMVELLEANPGGAYHQADAFAAAGVAAAHPQQCNCTECQEMATRLMREAAAAAGVAPTQGGQGNG